MGGKKYGSNFNNFPLREVVIRLQRLDIPVSLNYQGESIKNIKRSPSLQLERGISCLFHSEVDLHDENAVERNTTCTCGDCTIFSENKERTTELLAREELLKNTDFTNLPPLRNLTKSIDVQTNPVHKYKYTCEFCFSEFNNLEFFKHHQTMHNSKTYGCPYCSATFLLKKKLRIHLYYHLNKNFYECVYCRAAFEHKADYLKHTHAHNTNKLLCCKYCPAMFEKKEDHHRHQVRHERSSSGELIHVFRKVNSSWIKSGTSLGISQQPAALKQSHMFYKCRKCAKLSFNTQQDLKKHELIHNQTRDILKFSFICEVCNGRLYSPRTLEIHTKNAH